MSWTHPTLLNGKFLTVSQTLKGRLGEMPHTCCTVGRQNNRRKGEKDLTFYLIPSSSTTAVKTRRKSWLFIPK